MDLFALIAERPLLLDGGLGRALMERGFAAGECPEEWNVSHPAEVEDIHRGFFAAGSDIVNTNTFGGTAMRLEAHGLSARAVELNEAGARLAVGVRDREFPGRWVAGDIGPCGQMVKPMGDAEPDALRATFAEQARALVAGGVDLLNIETMFDLTEATHRGRGGRRRRRRPAGAGQHDLQAGRQGLPHHDGREPRGRRQGAQGRRRRPRRLQLRDHRRADGRAGARSWPSSPAASPTPSPTPASRASRPARPSTRRRRSTSPPWWRRIRRSARASSAGAAARRPPPSPRSPRPWAASQPLRLAPKSPPAGVRPACRIHRSSPS